MTTLAMELPLREKLQVPNKHYQFTVGIIFAYLFHRISQQEMVEELKDRLDPPKIKSVVTLAKKDGHILKNCKLFSWAYFKHRHGGQKPKALDFELSRGDTQILSRINLNHLKLDYQAHSLSEFDKLVGEVVYGQAINTYMAKFISKKMSFLIRSYGITRADIEGELEASAIKALYMHYPRYESYLHCENIVRTTIHNCGHTLITYHTSPARQRLIATSPGVFEARHTDIANLSQTPVTFSHSLYEWKDELEALVQVCKKKKVAKEVRRFILCCAGQFDSGFSAYLGRDNSEIVDTVNYGRYVKKAQKYFGYEDAEVSRLFASLRRHLI